MTITEFLNARLDEDEHQARLTIENRTDRGPGTGRPFDAFGHMEVGEIYVLADVEARRQIVAMHGLAVAIDEVLDHLASVYADHPDYDPAWRVDA